VDVDADAADADDVDERSSPPQLERGASAVSGLRRHLRRVAHTAWKPRRGRWIADWLSAAGQSRLRPCQEHISRHGALLRVVSAAVRSCREARGRRRGAGGRCRGPGARRGGRALAVRARGRGSAGPALGAAAAGPRDAGARASSHGGRAHRGCLATGPAVFGDFAGCSGRSAGCSVCGSGFDPFTLVSCGRKSVCQAEGG
ncbi:unnamed protein product, partial [Prorocentrum cordatum]